MKNNAALQLVTEDRREKAFSLTVGALLTFLFLYIGADKSLSLNGVAIAFFVWTLFFLDKRFQSELLKRVPRARYHLFEILIIGIYPTVATASLALFIALLRALLFSEVLDRDVGESSRTKLFLDLGAEKAHFALKRRNLICALIVVFTAALLLVLRKIWPDGADAFDFLPFALSVLFALQMLPSPANLPKSKEFS